ncbi:MAG: hypothetical protein IKS78_06175 [Clostridia bacterium]|nr:hypothetical protein [Clostridia bacterium]MBR5984778.1 hypothetical protein [Clostridia bacterium]
MKKHKLARYIIIILVIALTAVLLYGAVNARTVRLKYGRIAFSGTGMVKVAYISDLNISTRWGASRAYRLIKRVCAEGAEVLLINGIAAPSLTDEIGVLTGILSREEADEKLCAARRHLSELLRELDLPGGVYATLSNREPAPARDEMDGAITYLGGYARAQIRGSTLNIFGFSPQMAASTNSLRLGNTGSGPMLVMFNSPEYYNQAALAAENRGGGRSSYFFLCGGTLDGQIRAAGEPLLSRAFLKKLDAGRDKNGIYADKSGYRMLLSPGAGTRYLPLRLGTQPMAYLIEVSY